MRLARRLALTAIGAAHLAVLAVGPHIDATPAPAGHQHHLAAESDAGCHPYHDDHCVVCRVLSTDPMVVAPGPAAPVACPTPAALTAGDPEGFAPRDIAAPIRARAPPVT